MASKKNPIRLGNSLQGISNLLASFVCILSGLLVGFLALLVLGGITMSQEGTAFSFSQLLTTTWEQGFKPILQGGFYAKANTMGMGVRMEILQAAPLIMTGLSVAFLSASPLRPACSTSARPDSIPWALSSRCTPR